MRHYLRSTGDPIQVDCSFFMQKIMCDFTYVIGAVNAALVHECIPRAAKMAYRHVHDRVFLETLKLLSGTAYSTHSLPEILLAQAKQLQ